MIYLLRKLAAMSVIMIISVSCHASDDDVAELLERANVQGAECASHYHAHRLNEALTCYEALKEGAEHPLIRAVALQGMAYASQSLGNRDQAIHYMQEALHAAHPYDEAVLLNARLLAGYSGLLIDHNQYELAELYLLTALNLYETYVQVVDSHHQTGMLVYHVLANLYLETQRFDLARKSIDSALAQAEGVQEVKPLTSILLSAKIEHAESNLEAAIDRAGAVCESDSRHQAVVEGCILKARILIDQERDAEAADALIIARRLLEEASWKDIELQEQVDSLEGSVKIDR